MNTRYYAHCKGGVDGPFQERQLHTMYLNGTLNDETQICEEGTQLWQPLRWVFNFEDVKVSNLEPAVAIPPVRQVDFPLKPQSQGRWAWIVIILGAGFMFFASSMDGTPKEKPVVVKESVGEWEARRIAERWISDHVAAPSQITLNKVTPINLPNVWVMKIDFTAPNKLGGPVRNQWHVTIRKATGAVALVDDASAGKNLFRLVAGAQ